MKAFLIGLQFLTRISIVRQDNWTSESFGSSVRYFPLIGAVLGTCYSFIAWLLLFFLPDMGFKLPDHFNAFILTAAPLLLTGGIHADGFMDTMDGIFSGRDRERMLEIMKDSRVGSFGLVAFVLLILGAWSLIIDMPKYCIIPALFIMPVISRLMMVYAIACFPTARADGLGKAFKDYTDKKALLIALVITLIFVALAGPCGLISLIAATALIWCFANHVTRLLGGLTGDVYGAINMLSGLLVLLVYLLATVL